MGSITFANGSNAAWHEEMAKLDGVPEPERTINYRTQKPYWQNEVYHVPKFVAMNNLTNTSVFVSTYRRPRKHLHGFELTLDVLEHGDGLKFWREVVSCSVRAIEDYEEPANFLETYTINARYAAAGLLLPGVWLHLITVCCTMALLLASLNFM